MYPDGYLVAFEGALSYGTSQGAFEPIIEITADREALVIENEAVLAVRKRLGQLPPTSVLVLP